MSEPFVTFPGTSGNYVFTEDVNKLDGDTSHFHQSEGGWSAGADASAFVHDTGGTPAPEFGDGTGKATTDGGGAEIATLTTPTLTAVSHTVAVDVYTTTAGREAFITLDGTAGTVTALTQNAWTRITVTKTVTAGTKTVTVSYRKTDDSNPGSGESVWIDKACLVAGSDASFVPSLRIVGDLDLRAKVAADDWTPAGAGTFIGSDNTSKRAYKLQHTTGGKTQLVFWSGAAARVAVSTADIAASDGVATELRATCDVSTGDCYFYENDVQLGTVVSVSTGAVDTFDNALNIGRVERAGGSEYFAGNVFWTEVRDGISGPVVARFDANDVARALQ